MWYFNPRPPCGGRRAVVSICSTVAVFQSTPSVWRATSEPPRFCSSSPFQSTPSVWRATSDLGKLSGDIIISIHALRVEGDEQSAKGFRFGKSFQSTPSVWRATRMNSAHTTAGRYFNPRPPCGGRQQKHTNMQHCVCT